MNSFIEKIKLLVEHLSKESKLFDFFGLVKLIDLETPEWEGGFDIVVLAKWLPKEKYEAIGIMVDYLYNVLDIDERRCLGNVVVLSKYEGFIKEILEVSQNNIKVKDKVINGLSVREAIILEPRRENKIIENNQLEQLVSNILNELKVTPEEFLIYLNKLKAEETDTLMKVKSDSDSYSTINPSATNDNVFYPDFSQGNKENVRAKRRRTS